MDNLKEKIVKETLVYKGSFLDIYNKEVILPNENPYKRDVVNHPGATAIIAFLDEENILLVEQYRLAIDKVILEIPAGKINKNEELKECARRELQEETGYFAKNLEYLGKIIPAPGFCDETIHLYKATNLVLGDKNEDEDEFTNVKVYNIKKVKEMIRNGEIIDAKTISVFSYL